jgi:hypothetical protein
VVRESSGGRVREIETQVFLAAPSRAASSPKLTQYMGQHYTFRESVCDRSDEVFAHVTAFRRIHSDDQPFFLLAVTDCGGVLRVGPTQLRRNRRVLPGGSALGGCVMAGDAGKSGAEMGSQGVRGVRR